MGEGVRREGRSEGGSWRRRERGREREGGLKMWEP